MASINFTESSSDLSLCFVLKARLWMSSFFVCFLGGGRIVVFFSFFSQKIIPFETLSKLSFIFCVAYAKQDITVHCIYSRLVKTSKDDTLTTTQSVIHLYKSAICISLTLSHWDLFNFLHVFLVCKLESADWTGCNLACGQ